MPEIDRSQIALRDSAAADFDAWYASRGWWADVEMRELLGRFALQPQDSVADIGCGTGRLVSVIAPLVSHLYAGDFSSVSVDIVREKCRQAVWGDRVTPLVADMSQPLRLETASVDKVISLQAYQHVSPEGRVTALNEFRRILKPGGRLFIEVYAYPSWVFAANVPQEGLIGGALYYRRWTADELRQDVSAAGFNVLDVYPIVCWPQLRRLGTLGTWLELAVHRRIMPMSKPAYWLIEAIRPDDGE
ncbi:MAG: class I SAM-dependent methyltransferase [Candidatus Sericytochromatia bacterium]|nr:class I SAM-dependent methyltransferase [Candidatus Sericytochromatia bacterium]